MTRSINTVSNLAYLVAAIYVVDRGTLAAICAAGLAILTYGSWRYHYNRVPCDEMLDTLGMFAVLLPCAVLGLSAVVPLAAPWAAIALTLIAVLGIVHEHVYSQIAVGVMISISFAAVIFVAGWSAGIPITLFAMAYIAWWMDVHRIWGPLHAVWHVMAAAGFATLIYYLTS